MSCRASMEQTAGVRLSFQRFANQCQEKVEVRKDVYEAHLVCCGTGVVVYNDINVLVVHTVHVLGLLVATHHAELVTCGHHKKRRISIPGLIHLHNRLAGTRQARPTDSDGPGQAAVATPQQSYERAMLSGLIEKLSLARDRTNVRV